jgi:outer membrane usher protein FimD/PapC
MTAQAAAALQTGPGLSEIAVDGDTKSRLVELSWLPGGELAIDAAAARTAGLPIAQEANGPIALRSLRLYRFTFDRVRQRLEVQLFRKSDGDNAIDLSRGARMDGESRAMTALRLDYDLTATLAQGRTGAAGLFAGTVVRGNVSISTAYQFVSDPAAGVANPLRLDSAVQLLLPRRGLAITAGDFVSVGGQSQRALRLGGIQVGTDYSLRPDLITMPLPAFTGQVAVPTGLDVIVADQRYKLGDVQPGEFTVRNVPLASGRGEVAVVLRDSLGRETVQNTRFYVSRDLLAPGIRQFGANLGFVRRRYGVRSMDYGPLAGSIHYRRGLSPGFTAEASGEWTSGLLNAGVRGDVVLGALALATAEVRVSRDQASGTSGNLLNIGIESVGRAVSGRIGAVLPSAGYRDVAAKIGDPVPPRQFLGQVSFDLGKVARAQLSAGREERRYDPRYPNFERRIDVANANLRTRMGRRIDLFASIGYRGGQTRSYTAWAGFSLQLGAGQSAQASLSGGTETPLGGEVGFAKRDTEAGTFGYGVSALAGPVERVSGNLAWRSAFTRLEAQAEAVGGRVSLRGNARGSLILAGGAVFARNQTGGSYALVRTGKVDGVTVLRENRPAGVTAKGGLLLVENIPAEVPITFAVDPDELPTNALARSVIRRVIVPRRAVGLVTMDVIRFRPHAVRLTGIDDAPLPAGAVLVAQPSGEQVMVGYDGIIDFNVEGTDETLVMPPIAGGLACAVTLDLKTLSKLSPEAAAPSYPCRPALPTELVSRPARTIAAR